ncbi:interleukin-17 receptor B isoform 2-T2 [Sarcophilus harrisii]
MLPGLPSLVGWVVLWLSSAAPRGLSEQSIKCFPENGPSREWLVRNKLTPGGLRTLHVDSVTSPKTNLDAVLLNISWVLKQDGSIQMLKATKICVDGKGQFLTHSCVRCNYTEVFQSQTSPDGGKWEFHYLGFPIKPETTYFISAHNIPPTNMNEDITTISVNFTSPGCLDPVMKHTKKCQDYGSLWSPNISACQKEKSVEVNFSASSLGHHYQVLIISHDDILGYSDTLELNQSRATVSIPVTAEEGKGAIVQIIPYFSTCKNDCIRRRGTISSCPESITLVGLRKAPPPAPPLLPPMRVLLVYHPQACFRHAVCGFAQYLQGHCRSDVVLDQWQKRRVAEMGLVLWLTAQRKEADRVVFLFSGPAAACDGSCARRESAQDLFALAFNLFCSDLKSRASRDKYLVVALGEAALPGDLGALGVCPRYQLMKEAGPFCRDLLHL